MSDALGRKLEDLPDGPGVYLFKDARGRVVYVGKAKSLRKRVASYFQARGAMPDKTRAMVAEARDLDWLVTGTEIEALVLENSLVKKNKPRYNITLRDDKNFPHVRITTSERVPRMDIVRQPRRDDDSYFGPFVPASTARKTLRLLGQHFGIRSCKGPIEEKDHRGCLYYHLDQCLAPCAGHCTQDEYDGAVKDAIDFLKGRDEPLRERLFDRMRAAAAEDRFERAAHYRDLLKMLEARRAPQRMASTGLEQQDAWGLHAASGRAFLVVSFVRDGVVRGMREFALKDVGDQPAESLLGDAVRLYYHDASFVPDEVLLPGEIDDAELTSAWLRQVAGHAVQVLVPERGAKAERVRWTSQNARVGFELRFARGDAAREAVDELAEVLELPGPIERIECFDISNIQGADVVASLAVFVGGQPKKSDYRKFIIRGLTGAPDDLRSMHEAVSRRYRRLVEEGRALPDLVMVDGGLGQLGAAAAALVALELHDLPLISLAKREELIYRRGSIEPLTLPKTSGALQLVQRLRDEAHRFAVTFHRKRRSARTVVSALDSVPGIGPSRRKLLLRELGSVEGVREAPFERLVSLIGERAARSVALHLGALPLASGRPAD